MNLKVFLLVVGFVLSGIMISAKAQLRTDEGREIQRIMLNNKEYYLHVIQRGEGLYRISVKYGVSMQEILDANDDIDETLKVGQILRIPVIPGRNSSIDEIRRSGSFLYHTVEKGQTAFFVSRKYNVPLEVIYSHNAGSESGLIEGSVLRIPTEETEIIGGKSPVLHEEVPITEDDDYIYHTVQPKETLFGLSRQYHTTVEDIVNANPALRGGVLAIGSQVRIPQTEKDVTPLPIDDSTTHEFVESGDYLYHTIQEGQTFYSLSRLYQVDVEAIREANPGVSTDNMKVGYMLRIPRPIIDQRTVVEEPDDSDLFISHRVRRRETLFGISRHYHVDMDVIKKVNPDVNFPELRSGTRLKIPTDAWFARRTADALRHVPDTVILPETELVPELGDCIRNSVIGYEEPVRVALLLPFSSAENNRLYAMAGDSLQISREARNRVYQSKRFSEFYSGVLLSLDTLKKMGISVELSVYDISDNSTSINRVIQDPSLKRAHLIIGPGMSNELPVISAFSRENRIPLVFPLSNTNPEIITNPYLFHINTPDSLVYEVMADEVVRQAGNASLLVILPSRNDHQVNRFVQILKQKASRHQSGQSRIRYTEYVSGANDLVELQSLIDQEGINYVIIPSGNEADVSNILPVLSGVKEKTRADIRLFGMPDWLRFQTINPEHMHQLNATVFGAFGFDYGNRDTQYFLNKYRRWYYTEPHAVNPYFQNSSVTSGYSRFGAWGYDVAGYFISAIVQYGKDFDICLDSFYHNQVQFNFDFQRISNWGGFYNQGLHMLRFKPDLTTQRIPVNPPKER